MKCLWLDHKPRVIGGGWNFATLPISIVSYTFPSLWIVNHHYTFIQLKYMRDVLVMICMTLARGDCVQYCCGAHLGNHSRGRVGGWERSMHGWGVGQNQLDWILNGRHIQISKWRVGKVIKKYKAKSNGDIVWSECQIAFVPVHPLNFIIQWWAYKGCQLVTHLASSSMSDIICGIQVCAFSSQHKHTFKEVCPPTGPP